MIILLLWLLCMTVSPVMADPLPQLPPVGSWAAFPNSTLRPAMGAPPWNPKFIFDYSGGGYDDERDELFVWGGGHGDYPGNEVCTFPRLTGVWLCGPRSVWVADPTTETTADGNPSSRHTSSCIARVNLPGWDGFFCHGGSLWRAGWPTRGTWFYHRDTGLMERLPDIPLMGESEFGATSLYTYAVFDAARGQVLLRTRNKCMGYTITTKTWTWQGSCPYIESDASVAFDPERRVLLLLGQGFVEMWNTSTVPWTRIGSALTGDQTAVTAHGPGLIFDPIGKQYFAHVGGRDLYRINRDTWAVTKIIGAGVDPGPAYFSSGNQGRFRYVRNTDGLIVVSSIDANVFYYQLGGAIPPPVAFPLTLVMTGTGTGTVGGAGNYTTGTVVTLSATPGANSTFVGWSAPCSPTLAMPPSALQCTATFTATVIPKPRMDITITKPSGVDVCINGVCLP